MYRRKVGTKKGEHKADKSLSGQTTLPYCCCHLGAHLLHTPCQSGHASQYDRFTVHRSQVTTSLRPGDSSQSSTNGHTDTYKDRLLTRYQDRRQQVQDGDKQRHLTLPAPLLHRRSRSYCFSRRKTFSLPFSGVTLSVHSHCIYSCKQGGPGLTLSCTCLLSSHGQLRLSTSRHRAGRQCILHY